MNHVGFTTLIFLLIILLANSVEACGPSRMTDEQRQKVLEEAFYIGMVKTVEVDVIKMGLNDRDIKYVFEPIWPYTNSHWDRMIVHQRGINSCEEHPAQKGAIFEAVIFKTHDGFRLGEQKDHALPWNHLRQRASTHNEKFLKIEKECVDFGGKIGSRNTGSLWQLECIGPKPYPASDAGKECDYNKECEGVCMVNPKKRIDRFIMKNFGKSLQLADIESDMPHCSEYLGKQGCFYSAFKLGSSIVRDQNFLIDYNCAN